MSKTSYIARLNGTVVGKRTSAAGRLYTHAIVTQHDHPGCVPKVVAWCSRLDLARGEQRKHSRPGYTAHIVEAELQPSNARIAKAFNDAIAGSPLAKSGFRFVGKD